ncbi:dihydrolipoamide acetyltransferase family protein [Noviherbaspirillum denitrificans]|uniref:Dihydrolipoyllysine acetyltransferase n=1 Tax=Noviherbaspirillum denitrificans TaxID=1968433 RepID=A0A254TD70_9BURK|nr:dihydrolipoamide acetyltransferase family protein [Noviherbaspirillum denitrificans]OWW20590.1 dihydrolipoyllysine acetyltransferase [Noviherbaspirillum denitrificans]
MAEADSNAAPRKLVPLTGLRGAIARNMTQGWQAPRVSMYAEADMTECERLRANLQASLGGTQKVTVTAYIMRALALTLRDHPRLNALLKDNVVELMDDINLALAVSVPDGLLAPVIRNADRKTVAELAQETAELSAAARGGTLAPRQLQRGTFTLTNLGMTRIDWFTPIINPPQLGILGITRTIDKPVVKDGKIVIAPMMGMTLVFDHRAVDGYPAAVFLGDLKQRLTTCEGL